MGFALCRVGGAGGVGLGFALDVEGGVARAFGAGFGSGLGGASFADQVWLFDNCIGRKRDVGGVVLAGRFCLGIGV